MLSLLIALAPALAQGPTAVPDGARLADSRTCYTLNMNRDGVSRPVGVTWQTVKRAERNGRPVLEIVVHQSMGGGAFDMRDEFVLDAPTLRPLSVINRRKGEMHVRVDYADDRITGERIEDDGAVTPIDAPLAGPVWEGNLFGLTFAALPLAEGAAFSLPYWQYDKGFGRFSIRVTGSETVETASGPVEAWVVEAAPGEDPPLRYLIGKADHRELAYSAAQGSQTLGGDCSAIEGAQ
ncbi:MAG: hypothetical protein QME55_05410 [Brevundimonas sp.]|uniref:DUF3108 domain-containing protein n=1 Tax=Brevundimonas sp. TaxID=1871086 RepID=UPI002603220F|nr:hypothetical protein [Brevundimonas sp.]MDI6624147.1 hypothetical protein [Brevundimonas sp.]MDQ7812929.1 hypothetical protein [Brevundimonas sp.]